MAAKKLVKPILTQSDFVTAQVDFVPLALRDIKLEKSDIGWSDIGGALAS
jgi:peroxin-1